MATLFVKPYEIGVLKEAGRRLAFVMEKLHKIIVPGGTAAELDGKAEALIRRFGDTPAFLGYTPSGADRPYPATICVSINNEVVHGIPGSHLGKFNEGDIVSLDIGLKHEGYFVDMAKTFSVGNLLDPLAQKLIQVTEEALMKGIEAARSGGTIGDIGFAVSSYVEENGFSIVRGLGGHGIGRALHEAPFIPNFGKSGSGGKLYPGLALAIEPIVNEGSPAVVLADDGFTYKTKDGRRSAHFEHTILITEEGPQIITVTNH